MRLTKKVIDKAKLPTSGARFLRDDELRGFGVKVTPKGTKTFFIEKEIHGVGKRMSLGRFGQITLEQGRKLAQKRFVEIAEGRNPIEERRAQRVAATFADLEKLYLERHAVHNKAIRDDVGRLNNHLSHLRPRRLSTITSADLSALHADLGATGHRTLANAVLALLRSMMNRAREWGLLTGENPASKIKKFKLASRTRFVTPAEMPKFWKALEHEPNVFVRTAFFIGLLSGQRRNEVLCAKWTDVDLDQRLWIIPVTKAGRPHAVPLPALATEALRRLPRFDGNDYIFPGRHGRGHLVNVAKNWRRIRTEAGLPDIHIHDLRRTCASWMVAAGASLPVIGKTLNHSQPSTTQVYARLELEPVRLALESNSRVMQDVVAHAAEEERRGEKNIEAR